MRKARRPTSLIKGSRDSGSADEVLVIALAALTYDMLCGGEDGNGRSLEVAMKAVEGFSHGYVEGSAWAPPEAWRRGDQWIVAYLKEYLPGDGERRREHALRRLRGGGRRARRRRRVRADAE